MKKQILIMAMAVLSLAACQKEDVTNPNTNFPEDGVIRVATNVAQTRAGMTTSDLTDFVLHIDHPSDNNYDYRAQMKMVSGAWVSYEDDGTTEQTMLWKNSSDIVTFRAARLGGYTLPSNENMGNKAALRVYLNQNDPSQDPKNCDLLYAKVDINPQNPAQVSNGEVNLILEHKLSKLIIDVTVLPELFGKKVESLVINGANADYDFTFIDGTVSYPSYLETEKITAKLEGASTAPADADTPGKAKFEVILPPQHVPSPFFFVEVRMDDGSKYQWTTPVTVKLEGGNAHTLSLSIGKEVVKVGDMTTNDWTEGTGGNIETE